MKREIYLLISLFFLLSQQKFYAESRITFTKFDRSVNKAVQFFEKADHGNESSGTWGYENSRSGVDLSISPTTLTLAGAANSMATFTLSSNTSWTIISDQTWLTTGTPSGSGSATITITATGNTTNSPRTAVLTISGTGAETKTLTVSQCVPATPQSAIDGNSSPCQGSSQAYSIQYISGMTYTWSFPSSWNQTSGGTTHSVTVTVGSVSGNIVVIPSDTCGNRTPGILAITVSPLPANAGTISGTTSGCPGQIPVRYTVPEINHASDYIWTLPPGASGHSTTNSIDVIYGTALVSGYITVKGHNSCGYGAASYIRVTTNILPGSGGAISGATIVCRGQTPVSYRIPPITNATSYTWTLPDGASGQSTNNEIQVTFGSTAQSGFITVKGVNSCGEGIASTRTITVNSSTGDAGTISGTATVCRGQTSVVYSIPAITNAAYYVWTLPPGATGQSSTNSIVVTYGTAAESGYIRVVGRSSCGEGKASYLKVTVNTLPGNAGTISGTITVCRGQTSVAYSIPVITNASYYVWTLPSGATGESNTNSIVVTYGTAAESGYIRVAGHNACGEGKASYLKITVNSYPTNAGTISGTTTVCRGQSYVKYTVPEIKGASYYVWTLPPGVTGQSITNSIVVTYGTAAESGYITVKGRSSCGDGNASYLKVTVNSLPGSAGTISGTTTVCRGQTSVVYSIPAITNASYYVWTLPPGATGQSSTNSIVVSFATAAESGYIRVAGHNVCGEGKASYSKITVNSYPTNAGTISGTTTVCRGQSYVKYTVPEIKGASYYVWTLPPGTTGQSSTNSIVVTYGTAAESGYITVKGRSSCGDGQASYMRVTVNSLPGSAGTISGTTTVCRGQTSVEYSIPAITNASYYVWDLPPGATGQSSTNSIVVSFGTAAESGYIRVAGHNVCGEGKASYSKITVNSYPTNAGTISGTTTVCRGQSNIKYTVPEIKGASYYVWTLPPGATGLSSTNSIVVTYGTAAESGYITVKGRSSCGDGNASYLKVTVNSLPGSAGTISGTTTVCRGQTTVAYSIPEITNASYYVWALPPGATGQSNTNSIVVTYGTAAESGYIRVAGHSSCGEGKPYYLKVTVNAVPGSAGTISGTSTVCRGQSSVVYSIPAITNASDYIWTLPPGATGQSSTNSIVVSYGTAAESGYITVKGRSSCGDGQASYMRVAVNSLPGSAGTISGTTTVNQLQTDVNYTIPIIGAATSYTWTLPPGATGTSTTNSITVDFSKGSTGVLSVLGHNICGDGLPSSLQITVSTPGIKVAQGVTMNLYPSPNNGLFTFTFKAINGEKIQRLDLYNSVGTHNKALSTGIDDTNVSMNFDLRGLSGGMYMIKVQTQSGIYAIRFVILQ